MSLDAKESDMNTLTRFLIADAKRNGLGNDFTLLMASVQLASGGPLSRN